MKTNEFNEWMKHIAQERKKLEERGLVAEKVRSYVNHNWK